MLHADFYRLQMDKAITVTVVISLKGEAKGVKLQGGIVDFPHREVEVECLPGDIPEGLTIDVSELMIGQGVRLKDLADRRQVDAGQRPGHADRPRHRGEGRRGRAGSRRGDGRARSGEEGQGRRGEGGREGRQGQEVAAPPAEVGRGRQSR